MKGVSERADLGSTTDVRPKDDHASDLALAGPREQRPAGNRAGERDDEPLPDQLP
jgi:hypothetical protein